MKRIFRISIMLMLILALVATSVQAFTPPGQLKQMDRENATSIEEDQERYGPGRELPPGLRGKGTPPGLEKRDLDLPPGLENRRGNLPPGIQMRFVDALNREDLGDPEVHSVQVEGPDYVWIPEGENENVTEYTEVPYSAVVKDQYGRTMRIQQVTWELVNPDDLVGITLESSEDGKLDGKLIVTDEAVAGEIEIKAISDSDESVTGSLKVNLVSADADVAYVDDADDLKAALLNENIGVILLASNITIEEPLAVSRHLIIDGDDSYSLIADEDFEGWMIEVTEDGDLRLFNMLLDGNFDNNNDKDEAEEVLEGLVKVEKDALIQARNNTLKNAPVGFGIWMEAYEEDDEQYEEDKKQFTDQNDFEVEQAVVFYDEEGNVLYPIEDQE